MKRKWIILKQRIAEWWLNNIGYHFAAWRQQRFVKSLKDRSEIRVAFVANNVAMWKYSRFTTVCSKTLVSNSLLFSLPPSVISMSTGCVTSWPCAHISQSERWILLTGR